MSSSLNRPVIRPVSRGRSSGLAGSLLALVLVASACSSGESATDDTTPVEETPVSTTSTTIASTSTTAMSSTTPVASFSSIDGAGEFALGLMNGDEIDEATYEAAFAPVFRSQLDYDGFVAFLPQLAAAAPWTVDEVLFESETELTRKVDAADGSSFVLQVVLDEGDATLIETLFVSPYTAPADVASIEDGVAQLEAAGQLRLVVAEVTDGTCEASLDVNADEQTPLGSVFKLYVLAAVVDAIEAGEFSWDTPVVIRDELDSIPSGVTQDDEPGSELSVRELAERMISISDNTATDHLIDLVGRDAVVTASETSGHSDPSINDPFMTTREFTIIKFGGMADRWIDADAEGRRAILEEVAELDLPPVNSIVTVTDPISVNQVEWFASPNDVCRVLVDLSADSDAFAILQINPGVPDENERWVEIGYKGGSEPGVLAGAWLVTDADGRSFVVAGSVSNEDELVGENLIFTMGAIRDFAGS